MPIGRSFNFQKLIYFLTVTQVYAAIAVWLYPYCRHFTAPSNIDKHIFPHLRIWPPPKRGSWQQWISWILFTIVMFGVPLIKILDFQSLGYGHWIRFLAGGLLFVLGLGIDLWGTKTLSAQQSLGDKGKIITRGPYRYTRNPQYVGFIILYIGLILVTSSFMALVTGAFAIAIFF